MLSTIVLLFIVGIITLFSAFAGYGITTGENEDARKNK